MVFEKGKAKKSDYRKFRIKTVSGPDDYACMREVLTRRFTHGMEEQKELEEKEKSCIEQMKLYMQDNVKLAYAGKTLATWKSNSDRLTFDAKRFEEEHPELYKQYLTALKGSRPFIIK